MRVLEEELCAPKYGESLPYIGLLCFEGRNMCPQGRALRAKVRVESSLHGFAGPRGSSPGLVRFVRTETLAALAATHASLHISSLHDMLHERVRLRVIHTTSRLHDMLYERVLLLVVGIPLPYQ